MSEENKMYQYLLDHNYISKNENRNPLRQQELSKERAECIANKYNSLVAEFKVKYQQSQNNWNELKEEFEEELSILKTTFSQINGNYFMQNDKVKCIENILDKMQELEEKEVE